MLEQVPTREDLISLMGSKTFAAWEKICGFIAHNYQMDTLWNKGGRGGIYEYKFRKGGKTLCALYAREQQFGFMVIYGKAERERFEMMRANFAEDIHQLYDAATTYHDGKWIMITMSDDTYFEAAKNMILIKRNPNKRSG